jgi:uncharacterized membrane protein
MYYRRRVLVELATRLLKWPLALLFVVSSVAHFTKRDFYMRLMPPYVPMHSEVVAVSGVIEGALGLLLLIPRTQRVAAWGLVVTLIAIFPANIHGAITAGTPNPAMPGVPVEIAWLRLPIQPILVAWAYWYTR